MFFAGYDILREAHAEAVLIVRFVGLVSGGAGSRQHLLAECFASCVRAGREGAFEAFGGVKRLAVVVEVVAVRYVVYLNGYGTAD